MRVAAIDVGTNTVLCTIADLDAGSIRVVAERASIPRLGEGVDRTRRLSPEATRRTLACLEELAELARSQGVTQLVAAGTSALRDAGGGEDFVREASRILGAKLRVLDGAEEARLTFEGATWELALTGRVCVVDIGGGSTEIVEGHLDEHTRGIDRAVSLDIGSVRLFERWVRHDPPTAAELERVRSEMREALSPLPAAPPAKLIGVAGTVTTLVSLSGRPMAHGAPLSRAEVEELATTLGAMTREKRLQLPGLEPGRADVIPVGALLLGGDHGLGRSRGAGRVRPRRPLGFAPRRGTFVILVLSKHPRRNVAPRQTPAIIS